MSRILPILFVCLLAASASAADSVGAANHAPANVSVLHPKTLVLCGLGLVGIALLRARAREK